MHSRGAPDLDTAQRGGWIGRQRHTQGAQARAGKHELPVLQVRGDDGQGGIGALGDGLARLVDDEEAPVVLEAELVEPGLLKADGPQGLDRVNAEG